MYKLMVKQKLLFVMQYSTFDGDLAMATFFPFHCNNKKEFCLILYHLAINSPTTFPSLSAF